MYRYDDIDRRLLKERVAQHRDQIARHLAGELSDDELRPIRLQNGVYIERHAPMLRVAIPYGQLASAQLRKLAEVSRRYDRRLAHFTTRHNLQFNWPAFEKTPDILETLSTVDMHGIQSSGSCIRNITTDPFAGVSPDELEDPRPYCEILRQWSSFHPEFTFLPRKFKIAVSGATQDRAILRMHDLGISIVRNEQGETGLRLFAGGGMGRTPRIGRIVRDFLPRRHLLSYLEALLRVYNRYGRRDNPYQSRIKALIHSMGIDGFARLVESEWAHLKNGPATLTDAEFERIARHFAPPPLELFSSTPPPATRFAREIGENKAFASWIARNLFPHKTPGYSAVIVTLKAENQAPGNVTDIQMEALADLADRFSFGELRVAHEQNLVLPNVKESDLFCLWQALSALELATPAGLLPDMICCPGGDYCSLASTRPRVIASAIRQKFRALDRVHDIGEISLNVSGCVNSCGHHHVANIGLFGVDKRGHEWYQILLGGRQGNGASPGKVIGPAFPADEVPGVVETLLGVYIEYRQPGERFMETLSRVGIEPFRARVYPARDSRQTEHAG